MKIPTTEKNTKRLLLFISTQCIDVDEKFILAHTKKESRLNGVIYTKKLFAGMQKRYQLYFCFFSSPMGWWPKYSNILFASGQTGNSFYSPRFLNLPLIRNMELSRKLKQKAKKLITNINEDKAITEVNILLTEPWTPMIECATFLRSQIKKARLVFVVPDLPDGVNTHGDHLYFSLKKKDAQKAYLLSNKWVDGYVFFSKFMKDRFSLINKKFIISEGISIPLADGLPVSSSFSVVYTGGTDDSYANVTLLIKSFQRVKKRFPKATLTIAGTGSNAKFLEDLSKKGIINYLGQIKAIEADDLQKTASVLINLRKNDAIFRNSFPSKMMSYLSTGNPIVCFKLDSFPPEYDQVLFYPKTDNETDVSDAIIHALSLTTNDRLSLRNKIDKLIKSKTPDATAESIDNLFSELRD